MADITFCQLLYYQIIEQSTKLSAFCNVSHSAIVSHTSSQWEFLNGNADTLGFSVCCEDYFQENRNPINAQETLPPTSRRPCVLRIMATLSWFRAGRITPCTSFDKMHPSSWSLSSSRDISKLMSPPFYNDNEDNVQEF